MDFLDSTCSQLTSIPYFWSVATVLVAGLLYLAYYFKFSNAHFLIKGRYDINKKNMRQPPPPYPNGWYNAAKSNELRPGDVKPVDLNGQNMVLFRGKDGVAYALEAYCLHMGAHLGVGGQVVDTKCIECPFHGWLYDGATGNCVDHDGKPLVLKSIEYEQDACKGSKLSWKQKPTQKATLRKYPVCELNGYIYIWIHAVEEHQQKPDFPMIDVSSFIKGLSYRGQTEHHINCHLQDIPSNGADTLHFKYVHTYIIPQITSLFFKWQSRWTTGDKEDVQSFFEHERKDIHDFKQKIWKQIVEPYPNKEILSIGNLENWIHIPVLGQWYMFSATIIQVGLGIVFIILKSPLYQLVFHHYIRPQGINKLAVFHDCYISSIVPLFASSKIIELQGGQVTNDMYLWQSKSFARRMCLNEKNESDHIMRDWLKWSGQFYHGCSKQQEDKYQW